MDITLINNQFGINSHVQFVIGEGGLPYAKVNNSAAAASISLYGGQVLSYTPKGQSDLLWLSPLSSFKKGVAIRGGIPLCFPWFGAHLTNKEFPSHGFARLTTWQVAETAAISASETKVVLRLLSDEDTLKLWPYKFEALLTIIVGDTLSVSLNFINAGDTPVHVTDALHTYFNISNASSIKIEGFANTAYFKGFEVEPTGFQHDEELIIDREVNQRYINHTNTCKICDKEWNRNVIVKKTGSTSTVVWNPWIETTKTMKDIPADGYKNFVCIEAANINNNTIILKPAESHTIETIIYVER